MRPGCPVGPSARGMASSTPEREKMRLAVVLHRNQHGDGAWRVTWSDIEGDRGIAQGELLAVSDVQIAGGRRPEFAARIGGRQLRDHIPIHRRHEHARMRGVLQIFRAAEMVIMAVRKDGVISSAPGRGPASCSQPR